MRVRSAETFVRSNDERRVAMLGPPKIDFSSVIPHLEMGVVQSAAGPAKRMRFSSGSETTNVLAPQGSFLSACSKETPAA